MRNAQRPYVADLMANPALTVPGSHVPRRRHLLRRVRANATGLSLPRRKLAAWGIEAGAIGPQVTPRLSAKCESARARACPALLLGCVREGQTLGRGPGDDEATSRETRQAPRPASSHAASVASCLHSPREIPGPAARETARRRLRASRGTPGSSESAPPDR